MEDWYSSVFYSFFLTFKKSSYYESAKTIPFNINTLYFRFDPKDMGSGV